MIRFILVAAVVAAVAVSLDYNNRQVRLEKSRDMFHLMCNRGGGALTVHVEYKEIVGMYCGFMNNGGVFWDRGEVSVKED